MSVKSRKRRKARRRGVLRKQLWPAAPQGPGELVNVPGDCKTIGEALARIGPHAGVVMLAPGYSENVTSGVFYAPGERITIVGG